MQPERKQGNQNAVNLVVDLVIFLIFLVVEAPKFSGLPVHEWLGIAIGVGALTHVLLHWSWIIEISKRFFGKAQTSARQLRPQLALVHRDRHHYLHRLDDLRDGDAAARHHGGPEWRVAWCAYRRREPVYPAGCAACGLALAVVRQFAAALARHSRKCPPGAVSAVQLPGIHIVSLSVLNNL